MEYHRLHIDFPNSLEPFNAISALLGLQAVPNEPRGFCPDIYNSWTHEVVTADEDDYFDFINVFLNMLDGKYEKLAALGIQRTDILFWLVYEYDKQCAISFTAQEMQRLGENGIYLNIDCHERK